jgi:hypothetical protein
MLVIKENATAVATADGEITSEDGVFDVSPELGAQLIRAHGFEAHYGAYTAKAAEAKAAPKQPKKETAAAKKKREAAEAKAAPVEIIAEEAAEGTEITPENAGVVVDADGVERVGEIPVEASIK